jgi:hypothetical protein
MELTLQCEASLESPGDANALMDLKFVSHPTSTIDDHTDILPEQIQFEDINNYVLCIKININKTDPEDAELAWLSTNFARVAEKITCSLIKNWEQQTCFTSQYFKMIKNIEIPDEKVDILAEVTDKNFTTDDSVWLESIKKNQFTYMSINHVIGKHAVVKIDNQETYTQHQFILQCEVTLALPKQANELMKELTFVSHKTRKFENHTEILPDTIEFQDQNKYVLCVNININKTDPADAELAWLSTNFERVAEKLTPGLIQSREKMHPYTRSRSIFEPFYLEFEEDMVDAILVDLIAVNNFTTHDSDWLQSIRHNQFTYMSVNNVIGKRAVVKIENQETSTQHESDSIVIPHFVPERLFASRCFACKKRIRVLL